MPRHKPGRSHHSALSSCRSRRGTVDARDDRQIRSRLSRAPMDSNFDRRRHPERGAHDPRQRSRRNPGSGAKWVRIDINWARISLRPLELQLGRDRSGRSGASARGINVLGVIMYTPSWARPPGTSATYGPDPADTRRSLRRRSLITRNSASTPTKSGTSRTSSPFGPPLRTSAITRVCSRRPTP